MKEKQSPWDRYAKNYDSFWVQKYSLGPSRRWVFDKIHQYGILPWEFLDMGCGTGQLIFEIAKKFPQGKFVGMDASLAMIQEAQKKMNIDCEQKSFHGELTFVHGDICKKVPKELAESAFDLITCCHSFPYYSDPELALSRMLSLLKPEGLMYFVQGSINNLYDKMIFAGVELTATKAKYYSAKEFCSLASKYGKVEEILLIRKKWYMPSIYAFVIRKRK